MEWRHEDGCKITSSVAVKGGTLYLGMKYKDRWAALAAMSPAIYRSPEDKYYATDGLCTHEQVELADGLVMGDIIECPMHNGRFNYKTGEAKGPPVCVDLKTYPVKVENGRIMIQLG